MVDLSGKTGGAWVSYAAPATGQIGQWSIMSPLESGTIAVGDMTLIATSLGDMIDASACLFDGTVSAFPSGLNAATGLMIDAGAGADTIIASGAIDIINGGAGDDTIFSNTMATNEPSTALPSVYGETSSDSLAGGADADTFVIGFLQDDGYRALTASAMVTITDFSLAEDDTLDLTRLGLTQMADLLELTSIVQGNTEITIRVNGATQKIVLSNHVLPTVPDASAFLFNTGATPRVIVVTQPGDTDVFGLMGDDILAGESGNDRLFGADGKDTLSGGGGGDRLLGGSGDDHLIGGSGADTLLGGAGHDRLEAEADGSTDTLNGGADDDIYVFGSIALTEETIADAAGIDTITSNLNASIAALAFLENVKLTGGGAANATGNGADNILTGNSAANRLSGGLGADRLDGGGGNDVLIGGAGLDRLSGGSNDDQLYAEADAAKDTLDGGAGNDTYVFGATALSQETIVDSSGTDTVTSNITLSIAALAMIENVTITGLSAANATGNSNANTFFGNAAANTFIGGLGNDVYLVGAGDSVIEISGGGTADRVKAHVSFTLASSSDIEFLETVNAAAITPLALTGSNLAQTITGNAGANVLDGKGGRDILAGLAGNDVYIVDQTDVIVESAGQGTADRVRATGSFTLAADDHIEFLEAALPAGGASISLTGNTLNQSITGNAGGNVLAGMGGQDMLTGGGGIDRFVYKNASDSAPGAASRDIIKDFRPLLDKIDLAAIDANGLAAGNGAFTFLTMKGALFTGKAGELRHLALGGDTLVQGDINGDRKADLEILLSGGKILFSGDFIL